MKAEKTTKKIAKLEKKGVKYQSVYEKRVTRDAEKSAKLETKSAKKKRKATEFSGKFDDSFSGLPDEAKRIYLEISKLNKKAENRTLTAEEYKKAMLHF